MSKLVRIAHYRCDEFAGSTFLLAPDDTTEAKLEHDAHAAMNLHLAALAEAQKGGPDYVSHVLDTKNLPDSMTIGEAREAHKKALAAYKAWEDKRRERAGSFSSFMCGFGYESLPDGVEMEAEIHWGHRHGQPLNQSFSKLDVLIKEISESFEL